MNITNRNFAAILFLIFYFLQIESKFDLPNDFVKCDAQDSDFNRCAISAFEKLVLMVVKVNAIVGVGVPALNLPPLEPVHIEYAMFKTSPNSPLNIKLELRNITFYGFSNVSVISIEGTDIRRNIFQVTGCIPRAKVTASYTIDGRMLYLPLKNHGTTVMNLNNMKIKFRSENQLLKRDRKSYTIIENMTLDTEVESGNIFQKSAEKVNILGLPDYEFNKVLNDNFLIMFNEYKPVINDLIIKLIKPRLTTFNHEVPLDMIFARV